MRLDGAEDELSVIARDRFAAGDRLDGPAIVEQEDATTVVARGWRARVTGAGTLVLEAA